MPNKNKFNLSYSPLSYRFPPDLVALALGSVKGEKRREIIKIKLKSGDVEGLRDWLLEESLDANDLRAWGQIHPSLMGGEYLPDFKNEEYEIARVVYPDTVLCDVISIRAQYKEGKIEYSIRDEYENDSDFKGQWVFTPKTSEMPLALSELISLIDTAYFNWDPPSEDKRDLVQVMREVCLEQGHESLEEIANYSSVESSHYPELNAWYIADAKKWLETQRAREREKEIVDEEAYRKKEEADKKKREKEEEILKNPPPVSLFKFPDQFTPWELSHVDCACLAKWLELELHLDECALIFPIPKGRFSSRSPAGMTPRSQRTFKFRWIQDKKEQTREFPPSEKKPLIELLQEIFGKDVFKNPHK